MADITEQQVIEAAQKLGKEDFNRQDIATALGVEKSDVKQPFTLNKPTDKLDVKLANTGGSLRRPCKVGSYPPNPLGVYDMHGNILEWCYDWHGDQVYSEKNRKDPAGPATGAYKSLRGGSYGDGEQWSRSGCRNYTSPGQRSSSFGFRVVCYVRQD